MKVHDMSGKVVLITGANTGIGFVVARELARAGADVFIACRDREKAQAAAAHIHDETAQEVSVLSLDLSDFTSVRRCAADFLAAGKPLHVLINNGGLGGRRGVTASGFEVAFGTNHLGHFLLTSLLLDCLKASAPARIVTVASRAHSRAKTITWDALHRSATLGELLRAYSESKLANVLFSASLAKRLEGSGVTTYSLHPGVIRSDVWRSIPQPFRYFFTLHMSTVEQGAQNTLHLASSPEIAGQSGLYYQGLHPKTPSRVARDPVLAETLWQRSEAWTASPT
jgi:retinol dehydrogenase 12